MRKHGSRKMADSAPAATSCPASGWSWPCPGVAVGWSKFFPHLQPLCVLVSNETFLTLQDLRLSPSPDLQRPVPSQKAFPSLRTGSKSSTSRKQPTSNHTG